MHLNILREDDAPEESSVLSKTQIVGEDDATEEGSVLSGQISLNSAQFHCQECHSGQDGRG